MDAQALNEYVYALSKLSHIRKSAPSSRPSMGPEEIRLLRMLDAISLFLVTESEGDVAATTFKQTKESVQILFAKNAPADPALTEYINNIVVYIQEASTQSLGDVTYGVTTRVIKHCIKKVRARLLKLNKSLKDALGDNIRNEEWILQLLSTTTDLPSKDRAKLLNFVRNLDGLAGSNLESLQGMIDDLFLIAFRSLEIGRWHGFSKTDKAQRIQRRICKLGDYVEGAMFVTKLIRQHRIEQIQISEIVPPNPQSTVVWKSPLKILNSRCGPENETDVDKFKKKFPDEDSESEQQLTIKTSVHGELTVLIHLMSNSTGPIKIGVSKHCCWICEKYMDFFKTKFRGEKKIFVSGFQGKIHSGWMLPPGTQSEIGNYVQNLLEEELNEIRAEIKAYSRGDSWATACDDIISDEEILELDREISPTSREGW